MRLSTAFPSTLLAAATVAQSPVLEVELASDLARRGPPAWTWIRESVLPRLPAWPIDRDPLAPVRIVVRPPHAIEVAASVPGPADYLSARLDLGVEGTLLATCRFDGVETWEANGVRALPPRLSALLALCRVVVDGGPVAIDAAALTGTLLSGCTEGDLPSETATLGAAMCGIVEVTAWHDGGDLRIRGVSDGGLLLPAALVTLADWQVHPPGPGASAFAARPTDELERWLVLAASARHGDREEAARQLARFDDPRAVAMLERLLHAGDDLRVIAMASLIRAGATASLPKLEAAASAAVPDSEAMAEVAAATLRPAPPAATGAPDHTRTALWLLCGATTLLLLRALFRLRAATPPRS